MTNQPKENKDEPRERFVKSPKEAKLLFLKEGEKFFLFRKFYSNDNETIIIRSSELAGKFFTTGGVQA